MPVPAPRSPALRLAGVTVWEWDDRLRRRQPILTEVDWTVGHGEQWAVLGPNGAGKSTLLDVAAGMRHPSRGAVEIPEPRGAIAAKLGMTPESLSRALHGLEAAGLLRLHGRRVDVPDRAALQRVSAQRAGASQGARRV